MKAPLQPTWTPEERQMAEDAYALGGYDAVCAFFPNLSRIAIQSRLRYANIIRPKTALWTTNEERILREMWLRGDKPADIAKAIGRTKTAIHCRAAAMGLPRHLRPWTPGQLRVVKDSVDQLIAHLSTRLGRSPSAVRNQVVQLAIKGKRRDRARKLQVA